MTFPEKIHDYVGGEIGDFKIYELNKGRSLVYEPKRTSVNKNFIVFQKSGKYHFNLKVSGSDSDKDVEIRNAKRCKLFSLLIETKVFKLFECPKSLMIQNKTKVALKVNEYWIENSKFVSKGPPLRINGEIVYYQGRRVSNI
jgi:hypothetical protein